MIDLVTHSGTHLRACGADVLDVFSLQAVPGGVGSIILAFFVHRDMFPCELPRFEGKPCNNSDQVDGLIFGGDWDLLMWQTIAVLMAATTSAVGTWLTLLICDSTGVWLVECVSGIVACGTYSCAVPFCMIGFGIYSCAVAVGMLVSPEVEELGLDLADCGETAYDNDGIESEEQAAACSHL